ncbi:GGDEF domain-containing protein [Acinetobacter pragensis]|uniref:GGDEF domain-containing protein n=1 Tax=Acinetobacter pragensis TaxID=1806892 RepID=UPI00333EAE16
MKLQGSKHLKREAIQTLIHKGLNYVYFSKSLEPAYKQEYQNEAAMEYRFRAPIVLLLYAFLSFGIYQTIPTQEKVYEWIVAYGWVGVVIISTWLLSFFKKLNQYFDVYTCIGSTLSTAISFLIVTVFANANDVLSHAALMYAVIIIYSFVGMRFYPAMIAVWSGGLIATAITLFMGYQIDWAILNRTYTFSSILGMALCYAIDRQHRENYLQNCIIELNKQEMDQQAEQLAVLSQIDSLTGLANRRHLSAVLEQQWQTAVRYQLPLSILMVDLDYFKDYNDHLGHLAGDQCLQEIAIELKNTAARSSDLAARYGGEEFLLMFPVQDERQIEAIAAKLLERIAALAIPHPASPISPYVTVSIGAATISPHERDHLSDFIQRADQALYLAKSNGRNQYFIAKKAA